MGKTSVGDPFDCPECPACGTDLFVVGNSNPSHDWVCERCGLTIDS